MPTTGAPTSRPSFHSRRDASGVAAHDGSLDRQAAPKEAVRVALLPLRDLPLGASYPRSLRCGCIDLGAADEEPDGGGGCLLQVIRRDGT